MSAHVLISGTLFRAPEERTGKTSGKHFVAATIKVRDGDSGRILGAHLVGPHADEVINLFGLAIRHNLTADDLSTTMFAYPNGASDIGYML